LSQGKTTAKNKAPMTKWMGDFGRDYTDRNALTLEEFEGLYQARYGVTRTELNEKFLKEIERGDRVLEIGCNIGLQLLCLQRMGFSRLFGVEPQKYAVELSKRRAVGIHIIQGSGLHVPFQDDSFDLVCTSGVLIHISPADMVDLLKEIHRCTRRYIWGFEYWSEEWTEIPYRNRRNLLWKADYARMYLELFDDLTMVREEKLKHTGTDRVDSMFLLRRRL